MFVTLIPVEMAKTPSKWNTKHVPREALTCLIEGNNFDVTNISLKHIIREFKRIKLRRCGSTSQAISRQTEIENIMPDLPKLSRS